MNKSKKNISNLTKGKFLRLAIIADDITSLGLAYECSVKHVTPRNYLSVFRKWKPDILFVESAWDGYKETWKTVISNNGNNPFRNNGLLEKVVSASRNHGIPTVFWNKEDVTHFDKFFYSAKLFDFIFTVDKNAVPLYRKFVGRKVPVHTLMFAVQPKIHNFSIFDFKYTRANFVGSYSHHIHPKRRMWQNMLFTSANKLGVTIYDRNSERKSPYYRYPVLPHMMTMAKVHPCATAKIYKDFLVSLNVNIVENSPSMFSRRLVEILACGGIAVTAPSLAIETLFSDYCHVVSNRLEAKEIFDRLSHGPDSRDLERARAGAEYVLREHTWAKRLEKIMKVVGL